MGIKVKFAGATYMTDVEWTGSVWQRADNGQQSGDRDKLVRGWLETFVRDGGDDPAEHTDAIDAAVETAGED
jgi:hypothetical protein